MSCAGGKQEIRLWVVAETQAPHESVRSGFTLWLALNPTTAPISASSCVCFGSVVLVPNCSDAALEAASNTPTQTSSVTPLLSSLEPLAQIEECCNARQRTDRMDATSPCARAEGGNEVRWPQNQVKERTTHSLRGAAIFKATFRLLVSVSVPGSDRVIS
jgi:hypothetical protein